MTFSVLDSRDSNSSEENLRSKSVAGLMLGEWWPTFAEQKNYPRPAEKWLATAKDGQKYILLAERLVEWC